jgi:P27 family predicted phage terminase small subunit
MDRASPAIEIASPPAHLSPSAAAWWQATVARYVLEEHHLRLLQLMCEAWDRGQEARAILDDEGLVSTTVEGAKRAHPCIAIERDARLAVARLARELDLDVSPPTPERYSLPAIHSNRQLSNARSLRNARKASDS